MEYYFLAFLTGFAGSLHCLGMCAPLVLAFPFRNFQTALLYNVGRLSTYTLMGASAGIFGKALFIFGFQQGLSILAGVLMIALALLPNLHFKPARQFNARVRGWFAPFYKNKTPFSIYMIGVLNGLLPCGLIYLGIVGAIAMGGIAEAALYMFLFGAGTLPMMVLVALSRDWMNASRRFSFNSLIPVFSILIGVLFVIRGMNLGIPMLSPKMSSKIEQAAECCGPVKVTLH